MQNYNGKYRKQPHKRKYIITGIVGTVLVLSLFAIVFYKLGELSVRTSQEPVSETAALMQETYTEPPSTTETTAIVTTEATTAPHRNHDCSSCANTTDCHTDRCA